MVAPRALSGLGEPNERNVPDGAVQPLVLNQSVYSAVAVSTLARSEGPSFIATVNAYILGLVAPCAEPTRLTRGVLWTARCLGKNRCESSVIAQSTDRQIVVALPSFSNSTATNLARPSKALRRQ